MVGDLVKEPPERNDLQLLNVSPACGNSQATGAEFRKTCYPSLCPALLHYNDCRDISLQTTDLHPGLGRGGYDCEEWPRIRVPRVDVEVINYLPLYTVHCMYPRAEVVASKQEQLVKQREALSFSAPWLRQSLSASLPTFLSRQ